MKKIIKIIPHLTFILSLIFITLLIFDNFNPAMDLLDNTISSYALWTLCILTAINSVISIVKNHRS